MPTIEEAIDRRIGEVRTDTIDLSYGEIASLYSSREFVIQPDYQRLFRWSNEQRSRIVESILLELPIPQIFVIENQTGVIELIDGLQRISSVIQFIEPTLLGLESLTLRGCDLVRELNGMTFSDLSLSLKLRLKRSSVRTIVIKRQSSSMLRYEMFKRLNTGGSILAPQEIRNCTARMLGEPGVDFYRFLQDCAAYPAFAHCIESLSQSDKDQRGDEELVLRLFAVKNAQEVFAGSVRDWLDDYMELILLGHAPFEETDERQLFRDLFDTLDRFMGAATFVRHRGDTPIGALAPAYFEAITMGTFRLMPEIQRADPNDFARIIRQTVQSEVFRSFTGPGANSREKLENRITTISNALRQLIT
jgi:hypothetical protein